METAVVEFRNLNGLIIHFLSEICFAGQQIIIFMERIATRILDSTGLMQKGILPAGWKKKQLQHVFLSL